MAEVDPYAYSKGYYNHENLLAQKRAEQNQLSQQAVENDRNRLRDMYLGQNQERQQQIWSREDAQYADEQRIQQTRMLNMAAAEVAQNPASISRWGPQLEQAGILNNAWQNMSPQELQEGARQVFESTSAALQAYGGQQQNTNVQSTFQGGNGNAWIVTRDGKTVDTGVPMQRYQPGLVQTGQGQQVYDPNTRSVGQVVTPFRQQVTNAATEAGAVREAQEAATTASIVPRAQEERAATAPQRSEKLRQIETGVGNTIKAIDAALVGANGWTTGLIGSVADAVPGSPAYDLSRTLLTIKANIGFDRLQQMREASPTGGALGQVAVQELDALQASIASIDQAQSPEALRRNLRSIKTSYENWRDAVREANKDVAASKPQQKQAQSSVVDWNDL